MTVQISELLGKTPKTITSAKDEIIFFMSDESIYKFYHSQDCCETVRVEDIDGDIQALCGLPLLQAEEVSSEGNPPPDHGYVDSYTWTFYKFANFNTSVTVRWLGESNGYYSEGVDLVMMREPVTITERTADE